MALPARKRARNELARLRDEMDSLWGRFWGDLDMPAFGHSHWPALDVAENDNEYTVQAEVPGCKAEDVNISIHGNTLTISGEKKEEIEKKEKGYYHIERAFGSFQRDISLSNNVDTENIDAMCKDGILTIRIPKTEKAKSAKIEVKEG